MRIPLLGIVALLAALLVLDSGRSEAAEHPLPPVELTIVHANDVYEIQPVEGGRYGGPALTPGEVYTLELLRMIPGLELTVLDSRCCGIAGTYGFKRENYETSQAIGAPLFRQIEESGADIVVTDCETCKWQIEMSTSKRCEHPITLLAKALG